MQRSSRPNAIDGYKMNTNELISTYLEGWRLGDPELSLSVTAPGFYYIDPNTGKIPRDDFVGFMNTFKADASILCNGTVPQPFLEYSNIVIEAEIPISTVWCWWRVNQTEFQGSALIKACDKGILSEQIAYFTKLPS